mmetsp:Transcript_94651/g.229913  ORF Transcript_94651/g.229913 Transcript_94651/m.229913 type:complete len:86 (+) Transcript_94651:493-750(+)
MVFPSNVNEGSQKVVHAAFKIDRLQFQEQLINPLRILVGCENLNIKHVCHPMRLMPFLPSPEPKHFCPLKRADIFNCHAKFECTG